MGCFFGVLGQHWELHEPVFLDLNPERGKDGFDAGHPNLMGASAAEMICWLACPA